MGAALHLAQPDLLAIPVPNAKAIWLHLSLDPIEHERRQADGLDGITSYGHLETLMGLPVGEPIPIDSIARSERPALRNLPCGAVHLTRTHVARLAIRPCRVHRAVLAGSATRRSLERASRFAPFCARQLFIPAPPRRRDFLTEADFYGIGVTLDHDGEHEVLVAERPWRPARHTVAGWRLVEQAYGWAVALNLTIP